MGRSVKSQKCAVITMRSIQRDRECEEELELFREWKSAKAKRRRDAAFLELCRRSRPALGAALKHLTKKYSERHAEHVTVVAWRKMHRITNEDAQQLTVLAVMEAGEKFDPDRAEGNNRFTTYVYSFIIGKLYAAASAQDAMNHLDSSDLDESACPERAYVQGTATWKKVGGKRQPVPGGFEVPNQEERTDVRLRFLFGLDTTDGGFGKVHSLGAFLNSLDTEALVRLRDWLDENQERATQLYGHHRWHTVRFLVSCSAWVERLPQDVRYADAFVHKPKDGLPMQGVAIRTDGKKWNLDAPIRAALLEQQGKRKRRTAELLGMPWSTYKDLRKRMDKQSFSLERFTPHDLEAIARGNQGRKPNS